MITKNLVPQALPKGLISSVLGGIAMFIKELFAHEEKISLIRAQIAAEQSKCRIDCEKIKLKQKQLDYEYLELEKNFERCSEILNHYADKIALHRELQNELLNQSHNVLNAYLNFDTPSERAGDLLKLYLNLLEMIIGLNRSNNAEFLQVLRQSVLPNTTSQCLIEEKE